MYRTRDRINKKLAKMREAKARKRLESPSPDYPEKLPELRRIVVIIDFDYGKTVNIIKLYKTNRIDCYKAIANGKTWKQKIGWSKVIEGIRKSFVRVNSHYSL